MNIGYEISSRRKALGMTQESLAMALGVTNQAVSKWEMNVNCPDIQLLPALADILKVSIDELFGRRAEVKNQAPDGLPWKDDGQRRAVAVSYTQRSVELPPLRCKILRTLWMC